MTAACLPWKTAFSPTWATAPSYVGVDVSSHQGLIDWERVADAGVEFAMIRVGYRGYTEGNIYKDSYFTYNINSALEAGLEVGIYFYSQAVTVEEAPGGGPPDSGVDRGLRRHLPRGL